MTTTKPTGLNMPKGISTQKETPQTQPRKPQDKIVMVCHCGTHYKTTLPILQRGHGLACSGTCAITRRTHNKPAATRLDGQPLPITGLSVNKPRKEPTAAYSTSIHFDTHIISVPHTTSTLDAVTPDYAPLYTCKAVDKMWTVHNAVNGKKLMQVSKHKQRAKIVTYLPRKAVHVIQLRAQRDTMPRLTYDLLAVAFPGLALPKRVLSVLHMVTAMADQGVFNGHTRLMLALVSCQAGDM